jgi:hypothetical protein
VGCRIDAHFGPLIMIIEDRGKGIGPLSFVVPFDK